MGALSAILAQFCTTLLQSLASWGTAWVKDQQGVANELAAKTLAAQLASERSARVVEAANAAAVAAAKAPLTPAQWNAGLAPPVGHAFWSLAIIAALCFASGGCSLFTRYVYVPSAIPQVTRPPRPILPVDPPEFTARERILIAYGTQLEAAIDAHNQHARDENARNGY